MHAHHWMTCPGGAIPYDGSPQDVVDETHVAITAVFSVLGIVGLVLAVMALIFNLLFRKKRLVLSKENTPSYKKQHKYERFC